MRGATLAQHEVDLRASNTEWIRRPTKDGGHARPAETGTTPQAERRPTHQCTAEWGPLWLIHQYKGDGTKLIRRPGWWWKCRSGRQAPPVQSMKLKFRACC